MIGLILKDFINLKKYLRIQLFIIIFYSVVFLPQGKADFVCAFLVLFGAMPVISAMSLDDNSKWNSLASTMPVKRNDLVLSKYTLMVIFLFASALLCFALLTISEKMSNSFDLNKVLFMTTLFTCLGIIYDCINMPIIFKIGSEKAKLIMLLVLFIPIGIAMILSKILTQSDVASFVDIFNKYQGIIPIVSICVTLLIAVSSYFISTNIFAKKEF